MPLDAKAAQSAPAEPLSARIRRIRWAWDRKDERRASVEKLADEVAALEARLAAAETEKATLSTHCVRAERIAQERKDKLAAAERERDEAKREAEQWYVETKKQVEKAVAAERERCERWAKLHLAYDTADAIRDGRPAPK